VKIIGIIGQNGSGKDEVLKYLYKEYNIPFLSTGDIVREIAHKEGVEPTRENLGKISERYFHELGKGCFVRILAARIMENGWQIAGISGLRSLDDVLVLKEMVGKNLILACVRVTDPVVRYTRMSRRGEGRDAHSYEQFLQQDKAEEALFHIKEAEQYARYTLYNDGTLEDLHREIEKVMRRLVGWLSKIGSFS
jgi:dephospho-CoA kinase